VVTATISPKNLSSDVELKTKSHWSVRLGSLEWAKHTYERSAEDPLRLLGSARHGMQIGALAKRDEEFVLVVGDHVTALSHADNKELAAATVHAQTADRPYVFQPVPVRAAPPVVVVIKRRRVPAPH
jgi:hypothetical protein